MVVVMTFVIMTMRFPAIADRHNIHLTEMHAAFRNGLRGKFAHGIRMAAQQRHFHTMAMVEPRAH